MSDNEPQPRTEGEGAGPDQSRRDAADRSDADRGDADRGASDDPRSRGYRIPGRDFAGTSFAADEREQTEAHRGESRDHLMDDAQAEGEDRGDVPRDES
jgi:hypothetical protein